MLFKRNFYRICYNEGTDTITSSGSGNDTTGNDTPAVNPPVIDKDKKFTQDDLNRFLAEEKRKSKAQTEKTIKELEELKKSKTLTDNEKENLQKRIEDMTNSILTKEELAKKEKEKLQKTHETEVQSLTSERNTWKDRYIGSTINQAITSEAVKAEAFDVDDLIARLGPNTRLDEDKDEDGKPLGSFTPKVKYLEVDGEGKSVTLDLTVDQAVKRMKDTTKFAHLFKSTAAGGLGANGGVGANKTQDISKMSTEQYREWRKKNGLNRKKN